VASCRRGKVYDGSRDVTLKMAALVGAEGNVVGVDRDQSILQLARQEAERQGLLVTGALPGRFQCEGGRGHGDRGAPAGNGALASSAAILRW
jgi:hypothetical protein